MKIMVNKIWRRFVAFYRLDLKIVCEESKGIREYHDYPDSKISEPWHFYKHNCKRCGKEFTI